MSLNWSISKNLKFAVVGSGPAGFYTSRLLMRQIPNCEIHMFEKLPTPYGLIRYGTAPDRQNIKLMTGDFGMLGEMLQFKFFGNVPFVNDNQINQGITFQELQEYYSAVIFAYGVDQAKDLNVKNEQNIVKGQDFIRWYNSYPDLCDKTFNLQKHQVLSIIGNGNSALDIARMFCLGSKHFQQTDINAKALQELQEAQITEINIVGRRGAVQTACTVYELNALSQHANIQISKNDIQDSLNEASLQEASLKFQKQDQSLNEAIAYTFGQKFSREKRRVYDFLSSFVDKPLDNSKKITVNFKFLSSVQNYDNGILTLIKNKLRGEQFKQISESVGFEQQVKSDIVIKSIGLNIEQINSIKSSKEKIENEKGKIKEGLYTTGWAKTGPIGIVDTTLQDCDETVYQIMFDIEKDLIKPKPYYNIEAFLKRKNINLINWRLWQKIDKEEIERGRKRNKVREKIRTKKEMLEIAN